MKVAEEVEILIEGLDEENVDSILDKWKEVDNVKHKLKDLDEMLRNKIKTYLKEHKWDRYVSDKNKISVTISKIKKTSYDMEQLQLILSDEQKAKVTKTTSYEKMSIITEQMRKRLKHNVT